MKTPLSLLDQRRLDQLFRGHAEDLFSYAMSLTRGDLTRAADLVQEAFQALVVAWDARQHFSSKENRRWLFAVARNKAVDRWRDEKRLSPLGDFDMPSLAADADPQVIVLINAQLRHCLAEIRSMPRKRHRIAVLVWIDGRSPSEVAELLNISPSTVRAQVKLARDQIKGSLKAGQSPQKTGAFHSEGGQQ